jgi:ribonuclease III
MTHVLIALQAQLGHNFAKPWLLSQALTHRSFAAEHNERLEFLGDTVLNLAVTQLLFTRYPASSEGDLSRSRAILVRQETLHQIAQNLGVSQHMRLGDGEVKSGGFTRPSMLADTVEAFLDANYDTAKQVVDRLYAPLLADFEPGNKQKDPKSMLQEILQSAKLPLPEYTVLSTQGAAHQQAFEVLCRVDTWAVEAIGVGASRKIAEQEAATAVLAKKPATKPRKTKTGSPDSQLISSTPVTTAFIGTTNATSIAATPATVTVKTVKSLRPKQMKLHIAARQTPP